MRNSIAFALAAMLVAAPLASAPSSAQDAGATQKLDAAALTSAPVIPQMVVDPDGTLHFGPRTVPPPVLNSNAARAAYTKIMVQHAEASAARNGLASAPAAEAPDPSRGAPAKPPLSRLIPS